MHELADRLTQLVDTAPAWLVYLIACGVVYLETSIVAVGLVVPSEAVLVAAGVVAAVGRPEIGILVVGCALAALAGDSTGYWIGRAAGPRIARTRMGKALTRRIVRSGRKPPAAKDAFMAIASARWISYVRTMTPLIAGSRRMPFQRYALATAVGGTTWSATVLLVAYGVGATLGARVAFLVAVGVGVSSFTFLLVKRRRAERAAQD